MDILPKPVEFEWDQANLDKNWTKHKVSNQEAEYVFLVNRFIMLEDKQHSQVEDRYVIIGHTLKEKILSLIITVRGKLIRIISARHASRKERQFYEKTFKDSEIQK